MNCNISPIAFYTSRAAQAWRSGYYQRNIAVVVGESLPAFIINNAPTTAPDSVQIFDPNTDTLVATVSCTDIIAHTSTVDGVSVNSWIYQATSSGIWGYVTPGYYYLKIGNYYSDIIKFGPLLSDYVKLTYQFFDDIITADGTLISKYIVYQQIFETILWHPSYETTEEGKENNGIFYAMQQTLKKMCGFTEIVNVAQLDTLNLTRMSDQVTIEARSNGVIRNFHTNTFEIKEKWESDEVASIDVSFDLFNIVRKYQKSNVAPEPLPVPTPPAPPSSYYLRGTAEANSIVLEINGVNTTIPVYNGEWEYGYNTPLENLRTAVGDSWPKQRLTNVDKITTIDFSDSCMMTALDTCSLSMLTNCTSINFAECTFASLRSLNYLLAGNPKLTTIVMSDATFAGMTQNDNMFAEDVELTSVSMPSAVLTKGSKGMFDGCVKLKSISMPLATFANDSSSARMFAGCVALETISLPTATFNSSVDFGEMFTEAKGFWSEDHEQYEFDFGTLFPSCTAQPTSISKMFNKAKFHKVDLTDIDMSACANASTAFADSNLRSLVMTASQFTAMTNTSSMFKNCVGLLTSSLSLFEGITFANVTNAESMFEGAGNSNNNDTLALTIATFASVTNAKSMFANAHFATISLPVATFANVTTTYSMFYGTMATTINMPSATFGNVQAAGSMFLSCANLVTLNVPDSASWTENLSFGQSANLGIASLTALSKWCADMTAYANPQTLTFNSSARSRWQLPATIAQYTLAVSTLSGKNWTIQ